MATITVTGFTTADIHAARDAAGPSGTVVFPGGTYAADGLTQTVPDQTWLLDRDATIKRTATTTGPILRLMANGLRLKGGVLDGNRGVNPNIAVGVDSAGYSLEARDGVLQNVPGWGFAIDNAAFTLVNYRTVNTYNAPVIWRTTVSGVRQGPYIENCTFDREAESPTALQSGGVLVQCTLSTPYLIQPRILNNIVKLPAPSSAYAAVGIEVLNAQHVQVIGNKVVGGRIGISFGNVTFGMAMNNLGQIQTDYFVELAPGYDVNVQGNNASGYAPSTFGLRLSGGSQRCLLLGNKLRGFTYNVGATPDCSAITDAYNG